MVASLSIAKIDLNWADDQYWSVLFNVIREVNQILTPKKKEKVTAEKMRSFIKEE